MAVQVPCGGLTPVEESLVEHVCRGEWLDLAADDEMVDEAAMRSWGDSRTCRATVIRDILRGRLAADPDPHGLRLRGARISGRLDLENLTTNVSIELTECLLEEGILARDARLAFLGLSGCQLEHPTESALDADRLTCSMLALDGSRIIGHAHTGAIRLGGAHIGGDFDCSGAALRNDSGPALIAYNLQVGQHAFLARLTVKGGNDQGAVDLVGAHIGGSFNCDGASLVNYGTALIADGLQVGQDISLSNGFTATSIGRNDGTVRLPRAHIGGSFNCDGASLVNNDAPALIADGLQVGQDMFLRYGFTATGGGYDSAVRLTGAHIGGQLVCGSGDIRNGSGPALTAEGLRVDQNMSFRDGFHAVGGADAWPAVVNLRDARVGGTLEWAPSHFDHATDPQCRLSVDGLTYTGVPQEISSQDWLDLLRDGTLYAAQPYQQLAAGYRALGNERQVRKILMAQRADELARGDTRWTGRLWGRVTKVTLGYGYQPWRALLFLAAVVVVSCVLTVVLGAHGALAQTSKTATPGRSCTVLQQVSVGLDLNLPVGTSLARADCDLTMDSASVTAAWLSAVGWVLRLAAWVFAALFIAGFTSAVRKT